MTVLPSSNVCDCVDRVSLLPSRPHVPLPFHPCKGKWSNRICTLPQSGGIAIAAVGSYQPVGMALEDQKATVYFVPPDAQVDEGRATSVEIAAVRCVPQHDQKARIGMHRVIRDVGASSGHVTDMVFRA